MAFKVFVVSVMLLFSIAVVRSENQDHVNCTDVDNQFNSRFCRIYLEIINYDYLIKRYPNATEDFFRNVSQQLTLFCANQCKPILEAFFKCQNETDRIIGLNYGTCGKINQEFCYVHHLRGTTAGTIVSFNNFRRICPYNININRQYCVEGTCQGNVTQWANYMGCCTGPILGYTFNLTSCGITDTTPCFSTTPRPSTTPSPSVATTPSTSTTPSPSVATTLSPSSSVATTPSPSTTPSSSGTVAISSSVFIMIAIAIIQMYWM